MPTIETVLGPVDARELGVVLSHEHVVAGQAPQHYPWRYDLAAAKQRAIDELTEAKQGGVDSIIDLTTPDLGRDVKTVADVARASGVHVVVATGTWRAIPHYFWGADPDEIADIYVHEIEEGIDDTTIKAGAIKVANEEPLNNAAERVLRGAARALKRTGCPISTHQQVAHELGREQVRIFQEEGAPMDRICIGHAADSTDVGYLEDLLHTGVYLSMDRYPGRPPRPDWEARNATVKALIDRGWVDRLMLGHDYAPGPVLKGTTPERRSPTTYLHMLTTAVPAMRGIGITDEQVDTMLREVPRRFLTGEA